MKRLLRALGVGLALVVMLIAAVAFGARFHDGPIALFPGGPFTSGTWVDDADVDFSFASEIREIELQSGTPPRSRTVWILTAGREAYVPCSLEFPPGKRWHKEALKDPDAVVRIDGKRYRRRLVRVDDEGMRQQLKDAVRDKYGAGPGGEDSPVWFFQLTSQ